jgi:hypothetical protein
LHRPSLRTVHADLPHTALRSVVLPQRGLMESTMGILKAKKPTDLKARRPLFSAEVHQHTCCGQGMMTDTLLLFSPDGHSHREYRIPCPRQVSTFLRPFAPQALPRFSATTGALTPARLALRTQWKRNEHQPFSEQVSLVHSALTSMHSVPNHLTRPSIPFVLPTQGDRLLTLHSYVPRLVNFSNRLRLSLEGSSLRPAESVLLSYGLRVRLRLLSTPPRGDAVTFGYRERASPGRGLAPLCVHQLPGALGATGRSPLLQYVGHAYKQPMERNLST